MKYVLFIGDTQNKSIW